MSNSEVSFAVFDALLREAGFVRTEQADAAFRYLHEKSDTVVLVRIRDMRAAVPWGTFSSTRKILDGRGILSCAHFDQRVRELEQTLGRPVTAANGTPPSTRRGRAKAGPKAH